MDNDWDSKTVIGYKKQVAKVTKKDSDLNGAFPLYSTA
jgi:putative transcription factor